MIVAWQLWLAFGIATATLAVIPGPTVMIVTSYALSHGRSAAWKSVAGVTLANVLAVLACTTGLGALLSASAAAFLVLKWTGALYLIYLGIRMWREPGRPPAIVQRETRLRPTDGVMKETFLVTVLNPKGITFLLAFLPQFIAPERPLLAQNAVLGATYVGICMLNAAAYALVVGSVRDRILTEGVWRLTMRVGGSLLIGAGALTAALKRA